MTPKPIARSPVPHHCLGPGRASLLGHGAEAAPASTGAYRRMFPELPPLPSDEAFLQKLGTSCLLVKDTAAPVLVPAH